MTTTDVATTQATQASQASMLEQVVVGGDLSRLAAPARLLYYKTVCESVGLNPFTRPFEYITLNGKLTLYAKRDATDQLRALHGVSITRLERETTDGMYVVTAHARNAKGRTDAAMGAVFLGGKLGEDKANAMMKAETKAKRRVTLSLCGLGLLDESEAADVPGAVLGDTDVVTVAPDPERGRLLGEIQGYLNSVPTEHAARASRAVFSVGSWKEIKALPLDILTAALQPIEGSSISQIEAAVIAEKERVQ
jgi:hypothetical protein